MTLVHESSPNLELVELPQYQEQLERALCGDYEKACRLAHEARKGWLTTTRRSYTVVAVGHNVSLGNRLTAGKESMFVSHLRQDVDKIDQYVLKQAIQAMCKEGWDFSDPEFITDPDDPKVRYIKFTIKVTLSAPRK